MDQKFDKPTPEAKALSHFLMAHKSTSLLYKNKSRRISKFWGLVQNGEMSLEDYLVEVNKMLTSFGGYDKVVEQTVRYYIDKTGEYKARGNDKYSTDAQEIARKINSK